MEKEIQKHFLRVLDALSDDYETLASLLGEGTAEEFQIGLSRKTLIQVLDELIKRGLVKAMIFDRKSKRYEPTTLGEQLDDHSMLFGLTEQGEKFLQGEQDK